METLAFEKEEIERSGLTAGEDELLRSVGAGVLSLGEVEPPSSAVGVEAATDAPDGEQSQPVRHGYRADSPPEVVALLHRAQAGDAEAFGELYRLYVGRVRGYVRKRMWDENQDALPDVVQDTFCEAFSELAKAHHDVTGWLLTQAAKAYIRHARSNRQQERVVTATKEAVRREYAHGYARQHPGTITAIGDVMLVHALAGLSPAQREVVQHRYLDGQTRHATAIAVGKTIWAVKQLEYKGLKKMRERLGAKR